MKILVVAVFIGLLALNVWLFLIRPNKPLTERVSLVFQLVGVYTLGLGILAQTDIFIEIGGLGEEMTSANLFNFVAGNLRFLGIMFFAFEYGSYHFDSLGRVPFSSWCCCFSFTPRHY